MVYQGIPLVNLTECEIRSVLFGPPGQVEEWNLTSALMLCLQPILPRRHRKRQNTTSPMRTAPARTPTVMPATTLEVTPVRSGLDVFVVVFSIAGSVCRMVVYVVSVTVIDSQRVVLTMDRPVVDSVV
jgi:hypothetical protein